MSNQGQFDERASPVRAAPALLSASADPIRLAVESSTDCIKVLGLDGSLEYMNQGGLCVMEVDDFASVRGASWPEFWKGEERPKADAAMRAARAGGVGRFQGFAPTAKGNVRYWDVTVSPVPGPDGAPERLLSVSRDVTDVRRAERTLAAERGRLAEILDHAPAFTAVLEAPDLRFSFTSREYLKLVGHRDVLGLPAREALPEVVGQGYFETLDRVIETGETARAREAPVWLQRVPGGPLEERSIDFVFQAVRGEDGANVGVLAHGVDVTDQVRARREIGQREELFRTVFEQAPDDAILVMGLDRTITAWNPAAERICGWRAEEAIGQPADVLFTPEDREEGAPEGEATTAAREGKAIDERWHLRKDGSRFWGSGTTNALHDERGRVNGFLKVFRDATARRSEEEARVQREREVRERLDATVKDAPSFVAVLEGEELVFTSCNDAYLRLVGHRDILGKPLLEALPEVAGQGYFETLTRVRETGEPYLTKERPVTLQPVRGGPPVDRYVDLAYHPARDLEGAIYGVLAHGIDVTESVIARREIARAKEELEARVQERTADLQRSVREAEAFNYAVSHDLRTPLRAVASTANVLMEELGPALGEEHRALLERQSHNAVRMGALIDDLLRLSRLSRAEVRREPIDVTALARGAVGDLGEGCDVEVQEGMEAVGDPGLIRTVLQNLLDNAFKFSPGGCSVRVGGDGGAFWVRDDGVGFDMRYAEKIFLPFERLVADDEFPGTGIGLASAKRIVERHGGRLWVESEPGKGATFWFTLGETA